MLKYFYSVENVMNATEAELLELEGMGEKRAKEIRKVVKSAYKEKGKEKGNNEGEKEGRKEDNERERGGED